VKYVCLGYLDETRWDALSKSEQDAMMEECFAYDDVLRKNGHFVGGEALQSARTARTLRWKGDKVLVTDGPFAETREQLGGLLVLEAKDMDQAIELVSKHPGVRLGGPSRFARSRSSRGCTRASARSKSLRAAQRPERAARAPVAEPPAGRASPPGEAPWGRLRAGLTGISGDMPGPRRSARQAHVAGPSQPPARTHFPWCVSCLCSVAGSRRPGGSRGPGRVGLTRLDRDSSV